MHIVLMLAGVRWYLASNSLSARGRTARSGRLMLQVMEYSSSYLACPSIRGRGECL